MNLGPSHIRIFNKHAPVSVLGPSRRAVIWIQGRSFACPGCIVPESWDQQGGILVRIRELAKWVLEQDVEGLTLSGGEPMMQAAALNVLIDYVKVRRSIGVMCYTGFRLEHLRKRGALDQQGLLQRTDLFVDGTYLQEHHADLLWRGSDNQRLVQLTDRYSDFMLASSDKGAGVEVHLDSEGVFIAGVPSLPGVRGRLEKELDATGICLGNLTI